MRMNEDFLGMIEALSNANGPSGFEDEAVSAAKPYAAQAGELAEDSIRNLYIQRKANCGKPVIMLDAHSDEVGMMIHSIKPNGALRFLPLGSWSSAALKGAKVLVRNCRGEWIPGIVGAKPPHFKSKAEKDQPESISDYIIDVGAVSAEEAKSIFGIRIGEPAVPDSPFSYDAGRDVMLGKGFDCRLGCAALIETMRQIKQEQLDVDVVGTLSTQEEIGGRGCRVAVRRVRPAAAIVFEGCPADDTFTEPYAIQTALKAGPMVRFMDVSIIANPRFQRYTLDLAESLGLPIQASVREGGGNNGALIEALDGVPVIVLGIPVRYIHSIYGIASYYDCEAAVRVAVELLRHLDGNRIAGF